jgi:hypothetical protein
MPDDLKAVVLTAPEPRTRMTAADWARVELYAAPQAIEAHLKTARRALAAAQRTADRWESLRALRAGQVEAGTWPEAARQAMAAEEEARLAKWTELTGKGNGGNQDH